MKRVLLIVLLHLSLFLLFLYQAQAEEEWTIDSLETLAYARFQEKLFMVII